MKLYQLTQQHRELERLAEVEELDEQAVRDTLDGLTGEIQAKAQSVAAMVLNLEAWARAAEDASKAMAERAQRANRKAEWLRQYLSMNLQAAGVTKIDTPELSVSFRKNPVSVQIAPGTVLPARFLVQPEPPPARPDKKAIADALKAGESIEGCALVQTERLVIR